MKSDWSELLVVSLAAALGGGQNLENLQRLARDCARARRRAAAAHRALRRGLPPVRRIGEQHLELLRQNGRGAVVCTLRMGAFMLAMLELGRFGFDADLLAGDEFLRAQRELIGARARALGRDLRFLPATDPISLRTAHRSLREGRLVLAMADSNRGRSGYGRHGAHSVIVRFLGADCPVRSGAAWLAQQAGVPLLAAATYAAEGGWTAEYAPAIAVEGMGGTGRAAAMQTLYGQFERWIRTHPAQWEGWFMPLLYWPAPVAPRAPAAALGREQARMERYLAAPGDLRLHADPARAAAFELAGHWLALDGAGRRLLHIDAATARVLEAARRGRSLRSLRSHPESASALARLALCGLLEIR